MSWIDIGALEDIPLHGSRKVVTARGELAVFRTAPAEVFAVDDRVLPRGGPLSEGLVHGHLVTCPILGCAFDLTTGQAVGEPAQVASYPVRLEGGRVLIDGASVDLIAVDGAA